jgi:DNA uptake protein ComE-like DNA-binding protein
MKLATILLYSTLSTIAGAFVVRTSTSSNDKITQLSAMSRREALLATSAVIFGTSWRKEAAATSNTFMNEEVNFEPSQQKRGDKIDINGAFVTDYKQLSGMFPHAAGMIASHGPYKKVGDIYNIPGLTEDDKAAFKRHEKELTVLPPGRMFKERINQRQST